MGERKPAVTRTSAILEYFGSPRFSAALATAIVGTAFFSYLLKHLIGFAGLIAILVALVIFAALSLIGQRDILEWRGFLPISLAVFIGWSAISIFFSQYQWASLGGIVYQLAFAALGVYVALARDFIQIVRTVGDVLRAVIAVSLGIEILVGLLLDTSFRYLGITGSLAAGGPIEGVMGTRNDLGLVALLALITFGTEVLTRSIRRTLGITSLVFAAAAIVLSQSPVNIGVLAIVGVASLGLLALRRVPARVRPYWLWGLGEAALIALGLAFLARDMLLSLIGATGVLNYRLDLWNQLFPFIQVHTLQGWGWVGSWPTDIPPFDAIDPSIDHASALNAYFDVWFQLGLIGLFAFLVFAALAIIRAWILATGKRSRIFVWPALVLLALLATSVMESGVLIEWGWLTIVICSVKVAQHLKWRQPLEASGELA
ncbi:MAG: exopolysaccharide production protein ExoQ [Actinomycetota bacterium]|nr:exopolysaccharide production protein ExoQ [Actinomycetota bacterium]